MPQIGWLEILIVVVLAILIIGPKDFPVVIKKIGTFFDKIFGYSLSIIKFIIYIFLIFKKRHRIKIQPVFFALIHFYQNKLGDFDRKNKIF